MTQDAIVLVTFVAAALAATGIASLLGDLYFRDRARIHSRLRKSGEEQTLAKGAGSLFKDFDQPGPEASPVLPSFWRRYLDLVEQSGLPLSAKNLLIGALTASSFVGTAGCVMTGLWWFGLFTGLVAGVLPFIALRIRRRQRRDKLCLQLPEAFDLMARAIRAGQTVAGAFQIVARDLDPPLSVEFSQCYEQQNLGRPPDLALRDLARRTGVMELQMFVVALLVQRQAGGNVSELLGNLSAVVRKRLRLRGRVRALTGEGRMQAVVLTLLPVGVFVALLTLNRPYAQTLLDRPIVLECVVGCQLIGALWIRQIVNLEY
jgi:tight adherence protein B